MRASRERPRLARDKRDRLRQLRAFCETLRGGSVERAAERLGITAPAVSLHVRRLERELDTTLLERDGAPTPAGRRFYALADPLVRSADRLLTDFACHLDIDRFDTLRLTVSNAGALFVAPALVKRFRDAYPNIAVQMDTMAVREGMRRLLDDEADLALGPTEPLAGAPLAYHELLAYRLVLIAPPDHPLAGRASVSLREAAAWPAVVPPAGTYSGHSGEIAAQAPGINAVVEVGGWAILKHFVEAGFGVGVVPSFVLSPTERLAVVELGEPSRSFGVYARTDRTHAPAARRFLALVLPDADGSPSPGRSVAPCRPR